MSNDEMKFPRLKSWTDEPVPLIIQNPNTSRELFRINADGSVVGEIEDASEAARMFVESLRGYLPKPTQSDVERVARALAQADRIEICSDATYALSSYGHKAQAALAAMRQPTQSDALREVLREVLDDEEALMDVTWRRRAFAALDQSK